MCRLQAQRQLHTDLSCLNYFAVTPYALVPSPLEKIIVVTILTGE